MKFELKVKIYLKSVDKPLECVGIEIKRLKTEELKELVNDLLEEKVEMIKFSAIFLNLKGEIIVISHYFQVKVI